MSSIDAREIRRGSAYLLHWYGSPRLTGPEAEELSPSWEKVKRCAEAARGWLSSIFLVECGQQTTTEELEAQTREILRSTNRPNLVIVIDDCQRLGRCEQPLQVRLPLLTESVTALARNMNAALFAVWPDLGEYGKTAPQAWAERASGAHVVMVLEDNPGRASKRPEPARPIDLNIVKNRAGERGTICFDFHPAFASFSEI